jgi:hypothetical protein
VTTLRVVPPAPGVTPWRCEQLTLPLPVGQGARARTPAHELSPAGLAVLPATPPEAKSAA